MRTRNRWRDGTLARSIEENATALAYICWQIALDRAKNLHREDFDYADDTQRTGVIAEYLYFLLHLGDRLVYKKLDESSRTRFVGTLARQTSRHYQRNLEDVFGHGQDYSREFIDVLNQRASEYSECSFDESEPGYQMLRGLGRHVQDLMGESQTNRWVIDQVMELDAPSAVLELKKSLDNLFGTAALLEGFTQPE
jgi:hypothetical protein